MVLNFSNQASSEHLDRMFKDIVAALAEGSRYHSYRDSRSPSFLNYQLFKFIDLRDESSSTGNSRKLPYKSPAAGGFNLDYNRFFSDEFARYYGVRDAGNFGRFLRLEELVDQGIIHELWFFVEHTQDFRGYEVVEEKPRYDERFERIAQQWVQAGNGGDEAQKWTGRSLRIAFINASRGIGCFMESLSHGIEGMARSGAIPYFSRYFKEYAGMDLQQRYPGFPWESLYALGPRDRIEYPAPNRMIVWRDGKKTVLENYTALAGNVHFLPNGRYHYDSQNTQGVFSTIEDWRIGRGSGGRDKASLWSVERIQSYREQAPDCMGPWLIYWRQNFPGLDNRQKDDHGQPMKNWWPFLFY